MSDEIDDDEAGEAVGLLVEQQIQQQGVASFRCKDGQVFVFTEATLKKLLAQAEASGKGMVSVFVKAGPSA